MKQVHQYDLKGNFEQTWDSITAAATFFGTDESTIRKAADRKGRSYRHYWSRDKVDNVFYKDKSKPKVLIFDIEVFPLEAAVWKAFKTFVPINHILEDWFIGSWSAKWLGEPEIYGDILTSEEFKNREDKRVVKSLWGMLDEADFVIAHNAEKFDLPRVNTRFLYHGILPPLPYQVIDTLKEARKRFSLTSSSLNYLARFLNLTPKIETTGMELWLQCIKGEEQAIRTMEKYNMGDIITLEEVYIKLRPYIKSHPNFGLFNSTEEVCPTCGSNDLSWEGNYHTTVSRYPAFRCNKCGAIGMDRKNNLTKEHKKVLTKSVAR